MVSKFMTDYSIISRFRNKEQCELLVEELRKKGKTCYNFCDVSTDPTDPNADVEEQMKKFESAKQIWKFLLK